MIEQYKHNIREYYNSLDVHDSKDLNWYLLEHVYLLGCKIKYKKEMPFLCAASAILSINKRWSETKKMLIEYLEEGEVKGLTLVTNKLKQLEECNLEHDCIMSILRGKKIQNFYGNLLRPYCREFVTIDRWAARVAGENRQVNPKLYDDLKQAYIEVANEFRLLPSKLQSLLWCDIIKK
jgi:hypothetical protein